MIQVLLHYQGKAYSVVDELATFDEYGAWPYIWTDGNYSCDCNKSIFIRKKYPEFPDLECGDNIQLVDILAIENKVEGL